MSERRNDDESSYRSGFVGLVGPPNAGKSTLLNRVLGRKIAIVSPKPQTTRNRITGVVHGDGFQIVFIDTPGIHRTRTPLHESMVASAEDIFQEVDLVVVVIERDKADDKDTRRVLSRVKSTKKPAILAINKIDTGPYETLLPIMDTFSRARLFEAVVPVCALDGRGVDDLMEEIRARLEPGPPFFPEDVQTDQSEAFLAGEIIREQVFRVVQQEVPYSVAVTVEGMEERGAKGTLYVEAKIHVETPSQKGILIGRNGRMIKTIGKMAREGLETLFGTPVYLDLAVRVQRNWTRDTRALRRLGY